MHTLQSQLNSLDTQVVMQLINQINVEPLIISLVDIEGWSKMQAKQVCQRYLNFLCLLWLYPDRPLIPTQEIDQVWHTHILHTRQYRQDCQMLFGCYLDHEPRLDSGQPHTLHLSRFEQTKVLFERHFGIGSFEGDRHHDPSACGRPLV